MYRGISETMRDPFAINTIAMLAQLKVGISKSNVREVFYKKFKDKHLLLLTEFQETLDELGVSTFIAQVPYAKLESFDPPFWIELKNDQGEDYFTLITKVDGSTLYTYDTNEKCTVIRDESTAFENRNCMVLLVESYNPAYKEKDLRKTLLDEKRHEQDFAAKISLLPKLLTEKECHDIIQYCETNALFERSLVSKLDVRDKRWTGHSHARTSYSADMQNYPGLASILRKMEKALHITPDHLAPIHCVRYEPTQQFKIHHDAADGDLTVRSVFIYLNEGMVGGQTYFPEIGRKYTPETGTCLSFPNLDAQLKRIPQSLHASLPVTGGVKYVLTAFENLL